MSRLRAEMMPTVTVPPSPNGLPIAMTQSPMRIFVESPNFTDVSGCGGSTLRTERSVFVSVPTSVARALVEGLEHDFVADDTELRELVPRRRMGLEDVKVTEGVFTFVALDADHRPRPVNSSS